MIATQGVPKREWRRVSAGVRYPSSAMANGMRVLASTVLFRMDTLVTVAASVIANPSPAPPINRAASEKYRVCHCSQFPSAASENIVGKKYVAIDNGTTQANARG